MFFWMDLSCKFSFTSYLDDTCYRELSHIVLVHYREVKVTIFLSPPFSTDNSYSLCPIILSFFDSRAFLDKNLRPFMQILQPIWRTKVKKLCIEVLYFLLKKWHDFQNRTNYGMGGALVICLSYCIIPDRRIEGICMLSCLIWENIIFWLWFQAFLCINKCLLLEPC